MQYFGEKPGFCLQEYDHQIDTALARLALAVIEQKEESSRFRLQERHCGGFGK
jgi:hypothetical protein